MNAPAQIITALVVVSAAGFLPLSARFQEAGQLETVQKRSSEKAEAGPAGAAMKGKGTSGAAEVKAAGAMERIPASVSEAEAGRIISQIAGLDGKMLSSRQIMGLLQGIMSLPVSRMEEARTVIQDSKNPILGMFFYSALFSRWGELDPEAANVALESGKATNPMLKYAGAASLAAGWMEKDPDALLKWINESKGANEPRGRDRELRQVMMESLLMGMAPLDSATTEKLIASAPQYRRPRMIMDMAERDPDSDPRAAADRALTEAGNDKNQRADVFRRAGKLLADRDPQDALKYAEGLAPEDRSPAYQATMDSWLRKDKPEAMKWLKEQTPEIQTSAVEGMRRNVGEMTYEEVIGMSHELSPKAGTNIMRLAVDETARRNPQEALRYLPGMSDDQRPNGYQTIASEWTRKDSQAASEWIDPMPPGREKDSAIQGMIFELRDKDPASSTIWASTVGDDNMRQNLVNQSARLWLKRDPDAATEWINNAESLSEDQRAVLLKKK